MRYDVIMYAPPLYFHIYKYLLVRRMIAILFSPEKATRNSVRRGDNKLAIAIILIISKKVFYYTEKNFVSDADFLDGKQIRNIRFWIQRRESDNTRIVPIFFFYKKKNITCRRFIFSMTSQNDTEINVAFLYVTGNFSRANE